MILCLSQNLVIFSVLFVSWSIPVLLTSKTLSIRNEPLFLESLNSFLKSSITDWLILNKSSILCVRIKFGLFSACCKLAEYVFALTCSKLFSKVLWVWLFGRLKFGLKVWLEISLLVNSCKSLLYQIKYLWWLFVHLEPRKSFCTLFKDPFLDFSAFLWGRTA